MHFFVGFDHPRIQWPEAGLVAGRFEPEAVGRQHGEPGEGVRLGLAVPQLLSDAERGLEVSVVRYFNSYGPRIDERGYGSVIARFASQALAGDPITVHGDGRQSRSFTYVSDTVEGTLAAARNPGAIGNVFNIGRGQETTILELAERIRAMTGSRSAIELVPYASYYPTGFQDARRRVPDVSRANRLLGFTAKVTLEDGLARTLAWCRENYAVSGAR